MSQVGCAWEKGPPLWSIVAGGDKWPTWKFCFGGFCDDNMGQMGPKTI